MKKIVNYEAPEIEFTRFEIETQLMSVILPGTGDDGEDPTVPIGGDDWISVPDLELDF